MIHELNQLLRRLRQYENQRAWIGAVLDGSSRFAAKTALFALEGGLFRLRGQNNFDLPESTTFSKADAAAFRAAVDSMDHVVALRTPAEVSDSLSSPNPRDRAHLFPILNGARTVAVLFAIEGEDGDLDPDGLELMAGMASMALERRSNTVLHSQIATARPVAESEPKSPVRNGKSKLPEWANLQEDQRSLHIRAQRFSRVTVAGWELAKPEACRGGREQKNLYLFLKNEIEKARENYRKQFMTVPSMVDYLHLELVRTAAEGDELKLGADYPGPLV
ncbi:MAG TPA: hypothetical protein VFB14_04955 [Bryobacteraceae bacterium]|jgi:hypothetical protein|nr:hypothetical protein [Bryobacteraceae bacterium]